MKRAIFPGWWQVTAAFTVQGISAASVFTAYSVIAVALNTAFEPSRMVLMLGITMTSLAAGIASPALGAVIDRYSLRSLMMLGAGFLAAGFFLISFSSSMIQVLGVYMVCMAAASVLLGPMASSALLARWFERRRGLAMGIAASGTAAGGLLIPPLLQGLIDTFEWRMALRIFAVLALVSTGTVIALLVVNRPEDRKLRPDGLDDAPAGTPPGLPPAPASFGKVARSASFWLISLAMGAIFGSAVGIGSNLMQYVVEKGISLELGALLLSVLSAANLTGKLLCAAAADRVDLRLLMMSNLALLSVGILSYMLAASYPMVVLSIVVIGFSSGGALPLWSIIVARIYGPASVGGVMGMMNVVIMPFTLASAPLLGWIFDLTGSYKNGLIGLSGLLFLMLLLMLRLRPEQAAPPTAVAG